MARVAFHHLRIESSCASVDFDPVAALLAPFPVAPPDEGLPTIHIHTERARTHPADPSGYRQTFHHFGIRGLESNGAFLLLDRDNHVHVSADGAKIAVGVGASADVEFQEVALFIALAIALRHQGLYHMHAGAVMRQDGRVVLIVGDSGRGKSTVTLSLLKKGAHFLGDDALFLADVDGTPALLAWPRPFHLGPATLAAFPTLAAHASPGTLDKRRVPLDALPGTAVSSLRAPDLLLFPRVVDASVSTLVPVDPADAFGRALASSALSVVDGMVGVRDHLALLGRALGAARGYEVLLGKDCLSSPRDRMDSLLDAL